MANSIAVAIFLSQMEVNASHDEAVFGVRSLVFGPMPNAEHRKPNSRPKT
jgi:hypothetical protein